MALKDIWKDLIDGESDVVADDINNIAHSIIEIEKKGLGEEIIVDSEMSDISENPVQNKVAKKYVDDIVGDIETALDSIIAIQNELIGGDTV